MTVPSNGNVLIVYDYQQLDAVYFGVKRASGYSIFNINNLDYVGFLESNGKDDGYNWFNTELNWLYFVV